MPRKPSATVGLTLRIRESLRRRLVQASEKNDVSLNSEVASRLENSFLAARNEQLLEALLAGGDDLEFLRAISRMLAMAKDWRTDRAQRRALMGAIGKISDLFAGSVRPREDDFPARNDRGSADQLAWAAILIGRFEQQMGTQLTGGVVK